MSGMDMEVDPDPTAPAPQKSPKILIMMGMAGSGKTTFTQKFATYLTTTLGKTCYTINLDPASRSLDPFFFNIDITDSLSYSKVMRDYKLGPNGGIITALNLFGTKFQDVEEIIGNRARTGAYDYFLVDTPGQLECFLWSSSGARILQGFGRTLPTVLVFLIDSGRCRNPISFVSSVFYGIQVLFKNKLPMVLGLNKTDMDPSTSATLKTWLGDWEELGRALESVDSMSVSLATSMSVCMEEFVSSVPTVGLSSFQTTGIQEMFGEFENAIQNVAKDYTQTYGSILSSFSPVKGQEEEELKSSLRTAPTSREFKSDEICSPLFSFVMKSTSGGGGNDDELSAEEEEDSESSEPEVEKEEAGKSSME